jgi:uncharacterized glyoxalase superfamily protein PhnB
MTNGTSSVTPYPTVDKAPAAIEFYENAFGATELVRLEAPSELRGTSVEPRIAGRVLP